MAISFRRLEDIESRFEDIEARMSDPELARNPGELRRLSLERSQLEDLVKEYRKYRSLSSELESSRQILETADSEMADLALGEIKELEPRVKESEERLKILLLPQDPSDARNVILEIRAGAGGDEAALFVSELFRMYQRYAESKGWRVEILSLSATGIGGMKEIISSISGTRVYSQLKWEGGVHRVQRVPETEAQGRIHTSTVTVAVLPEAEEVDIDIKPADVRIDVFRSGGAGGQSVNTTDSAVRITHLATGLVVSCQDERSQHKNRDRAMKILRSRLLEAERERAHREEESARRGMVGSGDRSERIRTYNFPQGRLTDHRIGLTLYQLPEIMEGKIEDLLTGVQNYFQMEALKAQGLDS